jgi:hypothetical protein
VRGGWTKYALRHAAEPLLPTDVVWSRRKRGFEVPQALWIEECRPKIEEWIGDLGNDTIVKRDAVLNALRQGRGSEPRVWRGISIALWMRHCGISA